MSIFRALAVVFAIAGLQSLLPASGEAQGSAYATHGDSTLAALITASLEGNPRLRGAFLHYQAAQLRVPQATALPDPTLSVTQHLRGPQTRVGPRLSTILISQALPWFGKRADLGAIAEARAAISQEAYHRERAELVRQIKLAYYDLGYIDRALKISEEEEQLLRHYEGLARARYSQGFGLQQEVVKLQAAITRVLNRRQELLQQRADTEAVLNVLANRPVRSRIPPVAASHPPAVRFEEEVLSATGRRERPEVKSAKLRIENHKKELSLARRRYRPDFSVGIAWGNILDRRDDLGRSDPPPDNGRDVFSLTLGINVPLHRSRYGAAVREATARISAAQEAHRDAINGVELAVHSAGFRLATIARQLDLFERALHPQAEQALHSTEEAYSAGLIGALDLLDSEEVLLEVRLGLARLRADYMKALADMERAIGAPFPEEGS